MVDGARKDSTKSKHKDSPLRRNGRKKKAVGSRFSFGFGSGCLNSEGNNEAVMQRFEEIFSNKNRHANETGDLNQSVSTSATTSSAMPAISINYDEEPVNILILDGEGMKGMSAE